MIRHFYFNFCCMCDGSCCAGHRKLLVRFWTGSDIAAYTDRQYGSCNGCRFGVYAVRTKDITDAAKYHAGCHLSTKSRWYCPPDKVYSERNVSDRRNWCGLLLPVFCRDFGIKRYMDVDFSFHIGLFVMRDLIYLVPQITLLYH